MPETLIFLIGIVILVSQMAAFICYLIETGADISDTEEIYEKEEEWSESSFEEAAPQGKCY